jgi:hypothetical protein
MNAALQAASLEYADRSKEIFIGGDIGVGIRRRLIIEFFVFKSHKPQNGT